MPETISEAIVFVLDASRSMFRSDYSPNRLDACKLGIIEFIQARLLNDSENSGASAFGLVVVKSQAKKIFDFTDLAKLDEFSNYLPDLVCGGKSALGEGLGMAIKILIEDIRTNGARVPRIFIFSDGAYTPSKIDPLKMASLANQLGMKINAVQLGEVQAYSILKQITEKANGQFLHAKNTENIIRFVQNIAQSNFLPPGSSADASKSRIPQPILKKIASPLLTETQMTKGSKDQQDLIARLRGTKSYEKCSICFQTNDPISKTDFSISGAYCPNCGTPMHYSCASLWAKNQNKEGDGTIFRCVHCLYLLKIPASIKTAVQMHQNLKQEMRSEGMQTKTQTVQASVYYARELGDEALYSACPVCSGIFEEDEKVIKCGNRTCNAIYHVKCYDKLKDHQCKVCGSKMVKMF
ncbi:MAG: VWA domain-containing protein [Candidatus Lokiarchaeota archaeon]|nr:VWA domain-containing protein [Candidatus Harpocratesius repetitus]